MEVLCIQNSTSDYKGAILVTKGSRYNVTASKKGPTLSGTNNDIWYTLLETGHFIHHSSLFVVSFDEVILEEKKEDLCTM